MPFNNLAMIWDLETTGLEGAGNMILCGVFKPYNEDPIVIRYDAFKAEGPKKKERSMVTAIIHLITDYPIWVGHNIARYDWGMLKTRAYKLGVKCPQVSAIVYDTMLAWRRSGFLSTLTRKGYPSASMENVIDLLGLPNQKTAIRKDHWMEAVYGETAEIRTAVMNEIVDHCTRDVIMNEQIFEKEIDPLEGMDVRANFKRVL